MTARGRPILRAHGTFHRPGCPCSRTASTISQSRCRNAPGRLHIFMQSAICSSRHCRATAGGTRKSSGYLARSSVHSFWSCSLWIGSNPPERSIRWPVQSWQRGTKSSQGRLLRQAEWLARTGNPASRATGYGSRLPGKAAAGSSRRLRQQGSAEVALWAWANGVSTT